MPLQELFYQHITATDLFSRGEKTLLAVSGGIDSVVLAHLFKKSNLTFAIAHCNFDLRGEESEQDLLFVKDLSQQLGVNFYTQTFNTIDYAKERGISIQMAARELRYAWFEKVRDQIGFQYIATAHHYDDQNETVLINIIRGCGLEGLTGIRSARGVLIRPLLPFGREQISNFASDQQIAFREDSSNAQVKYLRNRIRHQLMPLCYEMNPSFGTALGRLSKIAEGCNELLSWFIDREGLVQKQGPKIIISIPALQQYPSVETILYILLKDYGFQAPVVAEIEQSFTGNPGKLFYSPTHVCLKDRESLVVTPLDVVADIAPVEVSAHTREVITSSGKFLFSEKAAEEAEIPADTFSAWLDYDKISFPLLLRHPHNGDYFFPFGMKGRKKISDFLTDHKVSRTDKGNIWLLCSDENILWVAGMRPDERYKITPSTRKMLTVKFIPSNK